MLMSSNSPALVMAVGSRERKVMVGSKSRVIFEWDLEKIRRFAPDLVLDFAFLTRGHLEKLGRRRFLDTNEMLTARLGEVVSLPSVSAVLSISSGLVAKWPDDPYARGKSQAERVLNEARRINDFNLAIARAWSVSGGFVGNPDHYALSSFVRQGLTNGEITVSADRMVYRRYCAVEELLAVGLHFADGQPHTLFDSGGEKLEMFEIAQKVAEQIPGSKVILEHPDRDSLVPDDYSSDNESWIQAVRGPHLIPMSIEKQIANVIHALRHR